jgi:endoglucanase
MTGKDFLSTKKTKIVCDKEEVRLCGVNLGGWLMMEAYILHAPNFAEQLFKRHFKEAFGAPALEEFERVFRSTFIQETDIENISRWGFNCIRVPFNHRLIETAPYIYSEEGLKYIDAVIRWAGAKGLWVILDLHSAPGAQNHDWHSDSLGPADLWSDEEFQKRTCALWAMLADRYKNEPWVAGYDLLNEPVLEDTKLLNRFYRDCIRAVRRSDRSHLIFIEGNIWGTDLECLDLFDDDHYALQFHSYEPLQFTFNFTPHLTYPAKDGPAAWGPDVFRRHLEKYAKISRSREVPLLLGEFGVNYRNGFYGEMQWLDDKLTVLEDLGIHWTYWTYKAVKNSMFPDGIYSYYGNPQWVHREGPHSGWDTYIQQWPEHKKEMIESWQTDHFQLNKIILDVLQNHVR